MMGNKIYLNSIARNMKRLGGKCGENSIFVSQYHGNSKEKATVLVIAGVGRKEGESIEEFGFLALRRLFEALKYRINEDGRFEFDYSLKRNEEG